MKKIIAILLALTMVFTLCACGNKKDEPTSASEPKQTFEQKAEEKEPPESAEQIDENDKAQLVAEDFELTELKEGELSFKVKLRNITDHDIEDLSFDYQLLDKNGDILCYQTCGAQNVAAGQAIWAGAYRVKDTHIKDAVAMSFVSSPSWLKSYTPLRERAVFNFEDYQ